MALRFSSARLFSGPSLFGRGARPLGPSPLAGLTRGRLSSMSGCRLAGSPTFGWLPRGRFLFGSGARLPLPRLCPAVGSRLGRWARFSALRLFARLPCGLLSPPSGSRLAGSPTSGRSPCGRLRFGLGVCLLAPLPSSARRSRGWFPRRRWLSLLGSRLAGSPTSGRLPLAVGFGSGGLCCPPPRCGGGVSARAACWGCRPSPPFFFSAPGASRACARLGVFSPLSLSLFAPSRSFPVS